MTHTTTDAAEARAREAVRDILTTLVSPECDDEWKAVENASDAIQAAFVTTETASASTAIAAGYGMARHLLEALNDSEELMNGDVVLTAEHAKQLNADVDAWEAAEPLSPEDAWDELVNVDDRTSPEEYPDMCLITRDELIDFMQRAAFATAEAASGAGEREDEVDRLAQFLHDEGNFDNAMTDRTWPEHPGDTGQRENGWVKIVPSDVLAHFRDVARRWLLPRASLPPATAPAMVEVRALASRLAERQKLLWMAPDKDGGMHQLVDAGDLADAVTALAALAAAPTIPATGEAGA